MINILDKPYIKNLIIRLENDNEYILLNLYGKPLKINDIGKNFLELCDGLKTIDEISSIICTKYNASKTLVIKDALTFFNQMDICKVLKFNEV
ncbi:PqqD family protein [Clostridium taeniosporum]|uniref:PqqD family protein n=1 Tax=Clostridium taeniosporum TaxID=394958 RepID=A0A1D7XNY0_9CLOT|nr:PqqD family protein [Clostridium taeniosporum]AOR24997.1 PqqD family protein [Clostridium taeniosporum]